MHSHNDYPYAAKNYRTVPEAIQKVLDTLESLRFGVIQLTVHDGRLMQVDVTERHRFGS